MGNPAYDARREAERADAERDKAASEAATAALKVFTDLMSGRAYISIGKSLQGDTMITIGRRS